jgi:dihydrofolate reductase
MGRNTWESLPTKPLPNRIHFVVTSKNIEYTNSCFTIPNLDYISNFKNAWIIGGAKLIETNWHIITEIHLTKTITEYPCDTFINLNYIHNMFNLIFVNSKKDHTYQVWKRE